MARPPSPMSLVMKHHLILDVAYASVTVTAFDSALSETFEFVEYYNFKNEKAHAVRRAVDRAVKQIEELAKRN